MAGILVGQPVASGAQQVIVGNPFSGSIHPVTGVLLKLASDASGSVYVGIQQSGIVTVNSGGYFLSGNPTVSGGFPMGFFDGVQLGPGQSYLIQKGALTQYSGVWPIYIRSDAACSGQARLYYEWQF